MADSVLIIGGESDFGEEMSTYLTGAGYEVTLAYNYVSSRMIIEDLVPDIIILDEAHQNGMDSFMACKHLNDDYGIPVIVVGKGPKGRMWKQAVAAGADYYIKKPFSYKVLAAVMKAILRRYKNKELAKG